MVLLKQAQVCKQHANAKYVTKYFAFKFSTSFWCGEVDVITCRSFIPVVCHYDIHLVVAIGNETSDYTRGFWIIGWKHFRLHASIDPVPSQLTTVSPVVDLQIQKKPYSVLLRPILKQQLRAALYLVIFDARVKISNKD